MIITRIFRGNSRFIFKHVVTNKKLQKKLKFQLKKYRIQKRQKTYSRLVAFFDPAIEIAWSNCDAHVTSKIGEFRSRKELKMKEFSWIVIFWSMCYNRKLQEGFCML
jgi:hypothetical protein